MIQKAGVWPLVVLGAFLGMASPAGADLTGSTRAGGPPALAASAIVYLFVPGVLVGRTWGEAELDRLRFREDPGPWDDLSEEAQYILGAVYAPEAASFVVENTDGPVSLERLGLGLDGAAFGNTRVVGALAEVGLRAEDLVSPPEVPWLATTLADLFFSLYSGALELALRLRVLVHGEEAVAAGVPQVDVEGAFSRGSGLDRHGPGRAFSESKEKPIILTKRVARSLFKVFLGICLGIFIWGFVRRM